MADSSTFLLTKRFAVVTGANKGIGFEICRQLAGKGVTVVLTARHEERGRQAVELLLQQDGISDNVLFHQLDVADPASVASLAEFVRTHFGKLDILVNNAGIGGIIFHGDAFVRAFEAVGDWPSEEKVDWNEIASQNYELAEECLQINYYGAKRMVEALSPLLQLSESSRIVNVSSMLGHLSCLPNEWAKGVLNDEKNLTEERVDEVMKAFLRDFKQGCLKENGWPVHISAYKLSKSALNAYTRILARKYPNMLVNCVCPGFTKTDMTRGAGLITSAQGAENVVRLALVSADGPSGLYFIRSQLSGMNAYTRIIAGKYPHMLMNSVSPGYASPGYAKTDINCGTGVMTAAQGVENVYIPNEWAKGVLNDEENLTEERVDEVVKVFLRDFKQGCWKENNWPVHGSAYTLSKSALNAYTRIIAGKHPNILVNSVSPGYTKTDMTCGTGATTAAQEAENVVRLALVSADRPSGLFFNRGEVSDL